MSAIRKLATQEPLVDVVNPDQVVSNYANIFVRLSSEAWVQGRARSRSMPACAPFRIPA